MTELADRDRVRSGPTPFPTPFPMPRTCPHQMPAEYAELRETEPVSRVALRINGKQAWLLTRYADVRAVLSDPRVSSDIKQPGYPLQVPVPEELLQQIPVTLLSMDPPDHTVQRRMLMPEFTVKRMQALRPRIEQIVTEHVDAMLAKGGPVDLVQALSLPVPSVLICELLGIPYADRDHFQEWSATVMSRAATDMERGAAHAQTDAYLDGLVTAKESDPGDDVISRLIERNVDAGEPVSHSGLVSMARILLGAGHETSANMISLGVLALLEHPEQRDRALADPAALARAVDEMLRWFSISDSATARIAREDIQVGDVVIRAGEGIIALNGSANRDPEAFDDPDRLDLARDSRNHLAFGYGSHQCIGQALARLELELVYRILFTRIPGLRLAGAAEELPMKSDALIYGVHEMAVTW